MEEGGDNTRGGPRPAEAREHLPGALDLLVERRALVRAYRDRQFVMAREALRLET